jgi:hypothetical protein
MRHLKSLRDFIAELYSIGDLQKVSTEVDLILRLARSVEGAMKPVPPRRCSRTSRALRKVFECWGLRAV